MAEPSQTPAPDAPDKKKSAARQIADAGGGAPSASSIELDSSRSTPHGRRGPLIELSVRPFATAELAAVLGSTPWGTLKLAAPGLAVGRSTPIENATACHAFGRGTTSSPASPAPKR